MLLSKTGRYALMATLEIARDAESAEKIAPVPAAELARRLGVPANYLSKILHQLSRAGVLRSRRGPTGGFQLCQGPETLRLDAVLAPVVPDLDTVPCLLGMDACREDHPCVAHEQWRAVTDRFESFLHETTLAEIMTRTPARRRRSKEKRHAR